MSRRSSGRQSSHAGDESRDADAGVPEVAQVVAPGDPMSGDPSLGDDRAQAALRQVARHLSSAMTALATHRNSADDQLRAAYEAVHEATADLAVVYAWLAFDPGRAHRVQSLRDRRSEDGSRDVEG
jgi:hypothetical protein